MEVGGAWVIRQRAEKLCVERFQFGVDWCVMR